LNDNNSYDKELVARVVAYQDTRAYGELVRRHQSQIRYFLRKLTRCKALADDLAQDCFIHAWEKMHTYAGHGTFVGWLLKIAYTTFLQSKRKSSRYGEILQKLRNEQVANSGQASEELTDLDRFMAVLTQEERAVVVLAYAYGMSHREISTAINLPIGTVKSIIFRGKQKIRERFEINDHQHG